MGLGQTGLGRGGVFQHKTAQRKRLQISHSQAMRFDAFFEFARDARGQKRLQNTRAQQIDPVGKTFGLH